MARRTTQSAWVNCRVTSALKKSFTTKATRHGKPSDVLRELIQAFADDRCTITPPVNTKEPLYHVPRNED